MFKKSNHLGCGVSVGFSTDFWVNKVVNVEVLRRLGEEPEPMNIMKYRKLLCFGHMLRGEKYQLGHLV